MSIQLDEKVKKEAAQKVESAGDFDQEDIVENRIFDGGGQRYPSGQSAARRGRDSVSHQTRRATSDE